MVRNPVIVFFVVLAASAAPVVAHHGGGTFDLSKSVTYNGTLTKVELVNPHSWLYFDVKEADGKVSHHRCEMRSVHVLRRSGWAKEQFPGRRARSSSRPRPTRWIRIRATSTRSGSTTARTWTGTAST